MKLKYRIKKYSFPNTNEIWIAQYKILGIWMNIDYKNVGHLLTPPLCYCESYEESYGRIYKHKENMKRAKEWWEKTLIEIFYIL